MRYSIQSQLMPGGPLPAESFGRIARCAAVPRPINGAATRSANEADINSREPTRRWRCARLRPTVSATPPSNTPVRMRSVTAVPLHAAARMQRVRAIGQAIAGAARAIASKLQRLVADYRRHNLEWATGRALAELDARALRDIGLDRSEIRSIARELAEGYTTRIRSMNAGRLRP